MAGKFSAQVAASVAKTKARMTAVYRESAQRTIEIMQEPGPSVGFTKKAVSKGLGLGKGGKASKTAFGPVAAGGAGNLPVVTGFLRASLVAGVGAANFTLRDNPKPDSQFSYDASQIQLVIAGADLNEPITAVYTARYARKMEMRYAFARLAAQRWQQTVTGVVVDLKARTGG